MKEKKNKFKKQARKVLPVLLSVLILATLLSVSVFASAVDNAKFDHVGCGAEDGGFNGTEIYYVCTEHGRSTYEVTKIVEEERCPYHEYDFYPDEYYADEDGYLVCKLMAFVCDSESCSSCGRNEFTATKTLYANPKYANATTPDAPKGMVGKMVAAITTSVTATLGGVGSAIVGFFDSTVLAEDGQLSTFAVWLLAFLGIAFALGVVKFITYLVRRR